MSGLWTPGSGEPAEPHRLRARRADPLGDPARRRRAPPTPEEIEAVRELHDRLAATPVADVIVNHAIGIWQLALVHLGVVTPPDAEGRRPAPDLAVGRPRDRRARRPGRRPDRPARRRRGDAARRAAPGPDALRRDRRRPGTLIRGRGIRGRGTQRSNRCAASLKRTSRQASVAVVAPLGDRRIDRLVRRLVTRTRNGRDRRARRNSRRSSRRARPPRPSRPGARG